MSQPMYTTEKTLAAIKVAPSAHLTALLSESRRLVGAGQAKKGLSLSDQALRLAMQNGDTSSMAQAQGLKGHHWRILSDYPQAIVCTQQAITGFAAITDLSGQIDALCNLAYVQCDLGNYDKALDALAEAQEIAEDSVDASVRARIAHHYGMAYLRLRNDVQARDFYQKALLLGREVGDDDAIAHGLNGLAMLDTGEQSNVGLADEVQQTRLKRAIGRYELSLTHARKAGNHVLYLRVLGNIGVCYSALGDVERALSYFLNQLEGLRDIEQKQAVSVCLSNIGEIYRHQGKYTDSLNCLQEALQLANEIGTKRWQSLAHHELSKTFELLGDSLRAFSHYKLYHGLQREIFSDSAKRKANTLAMRLEIERSQRETELQRMHSARLKELNDELAHQAKQLERQAREDALTGLANRRFLDSELERLFEQMKAEGRSLAVAVIDIDRFKQVNDLFSHQVGDQAVRTVAAILRRHTRASDLVGRFGGDEFVIAFPDQTFESASRACERIREEALQYDWDSVAKGLQVTLSIGIADDPAESHEQILAHADQALYAAKKAGRNSVCRQPHSPA